MTTGSRAADAGRFDQPSIEKRIRAARQLIVEELDRDDVTSRQKEGGIDREILEGVIFARARGGGVVWEILDGSVDRLREVPVDPDVEAVIVKGLKIEAQHFGGIRNFKNFPKENRAVTSVHRQGGAHDGSTG